MNCKPGDLAIIIHSDIPENIGAFVEVLSMRYPDLGELDTRPQWWVRSKTSLLGCDPCDPTCTPNSFGPMDGFAPDANLKPIRGLGITKTATKDEPVTA